MHFDNKLDLSKGREKEVNLKKTVLLVDDEAQALRSLKVGLMGKGYDVIVASRGQEALQRIEDIEDDPIAGIDIVVTDFVMPGMSGMDLLKKIRDKSKSLPVIMMTAYGEKKVVVEALRNQCDSFIEKPFPMDDLILEIERSIHHMVRNTNSHDVKELLPRLVHQINNPLMAITGHAQLGILDLRDNATLKRHLQSIIDATDKIHALNKQIMQIGNNIDRTFEKSEIRKAIINSLAMFEGLISTKNIVLEKELGKQDVYVYGSTFGLEQVLNNLILNAIDAMDGEPLKILKLRVHTNSENHTVVINVEDTGCGIPKDKIDSIFDPYCTNKKEGNGLGLAVVSEIIAQHNGKLDVVSDIDKGTCFTIELPKIA